MKSVLILQGMISPENGCFFNIENIGKLFKNVFGLG
ncbi:hypothetical protein IUSA1_11445 [Streptococcus iniae IUSA1]|nr:hypothetical protein IUSA1_11445 [Streptococcus iniae IUSA1]